MESVIEVLIFMLPIYYSTHGCVKRCTEGRGAEDVRGESVRAERRGQRRRGQRTEVSYQPSACRGNMSKYSATTGVASGICGFGCMLAADR